MEVAVAHPGGDSTHQHLAAPGLVDFHRLYRQRLVYLAKYGGFDLHRLFPPKTRAPLLILSPLRLLRTPSTRPKRLRGEARAFNERAQLGPDEVGMDAAAEAAIGAGDNVLAAGDRGVTQDTVGDQLRVLDEFG